MSARRPVVHRCRAAPSNAGTYTVVASFAGSPTTAAPAIRPTFTIGQATPTVTVTDAGGTYNGNPFPAAVSVTGASGPAERRWKVSA